MSSQAPLFAPALPRSVPLRDYQERAIAAAREAYRAGSRAIVLVAPTGAGKTRIGVELVLGAQAKGGGVLWLAHRAQLLRQAEERLRAEGVPRVGIIAPWAEPDPGAPIQVASVQTLAVRLRKLGIGAMPRVRIVVFDEVHHYAADEWSAVAGCFHDVPRIGLTATPQRGDGRPLGDLFDKLIVVASIKELQAAGHLVPCLTIAPSKPSKDLSEDPVQAYLDRCPGERAFVFASSVPHAIELCDRYRAAGVPSAVVHGKTPDEDRARALAAFRAGEVLALVNVFVLTEGVDVPEASACILARGCDAAGTFLQMVGRVLRPAHGKARAILIDLRGVVHAHGLPEADRVYSLEGKAIATAEKKPTVIHCARCDAAFGAWVVDALGRWCPACNAPAPPPKKPRISRERLLEIHKTEPVDVKAAYLAQLRRIAVAKGYNPNWALHRYKAKYGVFPPWSR